MRWTPPARPEWVSNLLAHGEDVGGAELLMPFEAEALIRRACESVELSDFGPDADWRPHFECLVEALEAEAQLHLAGRVLTGSELLRSLQNRLKLTDLWSRKPSVLDTPVDRPVFVTGSARSGTSITHELLSCDPAVRAPLLWEMLHPVECSEKTGSAAGAETSDRAYRFWHQLQPEYETMHVNAGFLPNECIYIFMTSFLSDQFGGCHHTPSYDAHLRSVDHRTIYREHRRILQTLEPGPEPARWVLKAPSHLGMLRSLFSIYPDARVVITHRDPIQCLSSALSLMGTLQWMRSEHVDLEPLVRDMPADQAGLWQDVASARSSGELPDSQFIDVLYSDLVADPAETIGRIYRELEWDYSSARKTAVEEYIAAKPRGSHGAHSYSPRDFGIDIALERERFRPYQERFAVPSEDG